MPKKIDNPYEDLDLAEPNWRDSLNGANIDALKTKLAEVAKNEFANQAAKSADEDLNNAKAQVTVAASGYVEITKKNKLKARYVISQLADKGDTEACEIIQNDILAAEQKAGG
jgi:hypothetical protein